MTKKDDGGKQSGSSEKHDSAIAARRARLRTSLAKQNLPSDSREQESVSGGEENLSKNAAEKASFVSNNFAPEASYDTNKAMDIQSELTRAIEAAGSSIPKEPSKEQMQEIAILNNIDQALGSCADHLVSLQKVAGKQIEGLKAIAEALQENKNNQPNNSLSRLMESLTAAIEPMKAIGELVPILDRLVSIGEIKEVLPEKSSLSDEQLAISLAQQLVSGSIDPQTFRAAYKAIFANDDETVLIHRLGELLGGQQLSGELFQAAYEALQAPFSSTVLAGLTNIEDDNWKDESESSGPIASERLEPQYQYNVEREEELVSQLAAKEEELESIRMQLDAQWKELVSECEELRSALQSREDGLREKEVELGKKITELSAKDSENQQLRAQMEQLRDETKVMMTDLQKQLTQQQISQQQASQQQASQQQIAQLQVTQSQNVQKQEENNIVQPIKPLASPSSSGFFDFVGSQPNDDLFASMSKPSQLFSHEPTEVSLPGEPEVSSVPVAEAPHSASTNVWSETEKIKSRGGFGGVQSVVNPQTSTTDKPITTTQPASFVSAVGSYGSGVRAQVFEVIVRQALAGTQWREICAVPMQSNNISPDEVEVEVKRRQSLLKK